MSETVHDRSSRVPAGLTADTIAEAALREIARGGVGGLTMSRVADRLGVRAPSRYHHVRDKHAMLQLVAAQALAAFDGDRVAYGLVKDLEDWVDLTADGSKRLRRHYLAHPGLAALMQATADADRHRLPDARGALISAQVDSLVRLGVRETDARLAFQTCAHWTLAAVAADSSGAPGADDATFDLGLAWLLHGLKTALGLAQAP